MRININRDIDTPIYLQIKNQIRDMVHSGVLREGFPLPPERKLAEELGVNRSTVLRAYQELKADGLIGSHVGKGTMVLGKKQECISGNEKQVYPILWNQLFSRTTISASERIISEIMEINSRDDIISFAGGMPSPDLYPVKELEQIQLDLLRNSSTETLFHSPVEGYYPLRESISKLLKERHILSQPKEVMILSGSQQGLDLVARTFLTKDDIVFTEEPTYLGAVQLFRLTGARVIGIPIDKHGMRVDILESLLVRYRPKLIYTLPTYQNPSGTVMSLERRYQLLNLAYAYQIPILEDDPYGELRYDGEYIPPIKALDRHGYVMYLSTFSKTMFLGMRIGWLVASVQVINKLAGMKQVADLHANTPAQYIFNRFLRQGHYDRHLQLICREYAKKRNIMLEALEENKLPEVTWDKPHGGYYIWCRLPERAAQSKLIVKAANKGVAYVPGETFYPNGGITENYIRLNFTYPSTEQINWGIKMLMEALRETLEEGSGFSKANTFNKKPIV